MMEKHWIKSCLPLFATLGLFLMAGCNDGPKLYNIEGVVNVDGTPTEGINLLFFRQGETIACASGQSKAGGALTVSSNGEDGIELGNYDIVAIYPDPKFKAPPATFGQSPPDAPDLFKSKYFKKKVSVNIASGSDKITIDLSLK